MTNGLTSPKATDRPPGPTPQAARGAPPPSDAFAGMLDAHQARTAIAEGQSESPEQPTQAAADSAAPEQDDKPKDGQGDPTTAAAAVSAALPVPVAIPAAPVATEPTATQMVVAGGAPTPVVQVVTPVQADASIAAPVAPAAALPAAPVPAAAATAAATAAPVAPTAQATAVAGDASAPAAADQAPVPAPAAPAQPDAPKPIAASSLGQQAADNSAGQSQADPKAAQTLQQARAAVAYARPAEPHQAQAQVAHPAAHVSTPVAPATSAAPATAPATPVSAATPVPLARAAEAVEHVLLMASSRGVTHARIALNPADLGAVDVHIRSTAEGIVARVVAHSADAVQTLQHAAGDLRRSLEEQGLNVLNLDIGQPGESGTGRAGADAGQLASGGRNGSFAAEGPDGDESTTQTTTLRLPSGVLVDVLA
jgi:flagellar hook-length control protein FliK